MISSYASSSYSNKDTTKERFVPKLVKKNIEDVELGVFGAKKYFKGVINEEHLRTSTNNVHHHSNRPRQKHEVPKSKTLSNACSELSSNSRRGLLVSNIGNIKHSKKTSFKSLLASIGCNCNNKDSVKITEFKQPIKGENNKKPEHGAKGEILELSRNGEKDDTVSDASSDLFEIENFSANENYNLFLDRQAIENNNVYAPSVDWSVVTANVSDFSNIIGGKKAAVSGEWCHRLDLATPVARIQADNKLIGAVSD